MMLDVERLERETWVVRFDLIAVWCMRVYPLTPSGPGNGVCVEIECLTRPHRLAGGRTLQGLVQAEAKARPEPDRTHYPQRICTVYTCASHAIIVHAEARRKEDPICSSRLRLTSWGHDTNNKLAHPAWCRSIR